jgi:hypothetical protein
MQVPFGIASLNVSMSVPPVGMQMPSEVPAGAPMHVGFWCGQSASDAQFVDGYKGEPPEYE